MAGLPIEEAPQNNVLDTHNVGTLPDSSIANTASRIANRLLGTNGQERYQTWPEKLLRDAISAPHDIMQQNPYPEGSEENLEFERSRQGAIPQAALNMAALAGTGGLAGGEASLGSGPFLRPALKYEGKIYKAPMGGEHMDAIPQELQGEFTRQALSGEDISNFNFGFMNHKGQFLDREKALNYAIDNGLISPHDAKYGTLTSTMTSENQASGALKVLQDAGHLATPEKAKIRLGQLLRDKAASKKAGDDVESSDYMFYNNQIRALRDHLKD